MTGQVNFSQSLWQESFLKALDIQPKSDENKENSTSSRDTSSFKVSDFLFPWNEIDTGVLQDCFRERLTNQTETVQKILIGQIPELKDLKNACLGFTGSDGRAEKLSSFSSPLELMFLVNHVKDVDEEILQKIQTVASKHSTLFYKEIEVKSIQTHSLVCFDKNQNWKNSNKDDRPFPTRALDATFLIGETSIFKDYKDKFHEEVESQDSKKRLASFKNSAIRPAMQLLQRSEKGLATSDIDVAKGSMTFNGDRIKATKQALLRPVQYKIGAHICKLIQEKKLTKDNLKSMPTSIIDRIQWLANKNLLKVSEAQLSKVQKAYTAALIWAGLAQKNFEVNEETTTHVSVQDLKEVAKAINDFCTSPAIFG